MQEKFTKAVYKKWKEAHPDARAHPDEELLAGFLEGKLSGDEVRIIEEHILGCPLCAERASVLINSDLRDMEVPRECIEKAKNLVSSQPTASFLEIILKLKEKSLEILSTTGDVLVGQELVPAPVLRSRQIGDFKDEVNILKDFEHLRVEVKVENKNGKEFNLTVVAKEKNSQKPIKDLRVTLIKEETELESYHAQSGKVTFEHVLLGVYEVEFSSIEERLARIVLDIRA